jgi:hypothetical protein
MELLSLLLWLLLVLLLAYGATFGVDSDGERSVVFGSYIVEDGCDI